MNQSLNPKVSSIADAVLGLTAALMHVKPAPAGQHVVMIRHVHEGRSLVELRVMRNSELRPARGSIEYGVRQAWIYTYPNEGAFELHFTTREDVLKFIKDHPHLNNNVSLLFTMATRTQPKFLLADIYAACDVLHSFLTDTTDPVPEAGGNVESDLPTRND